MINSFRKIKIIQSTLCLWEIMALTPSNTCAHLALKKQLLIKQRLEYHGNNMVFLQITEFLTLKYLSKHLYNSQHPCLSLSY